LKKGVLIYFILICAVAKVQSQVFCILNNYPYSPCDSFRVDIRILTNTFNHLHDSTDYFSSGNLKSFQIIKHDTLSVTRIWGKDTVLNVGEYTMLLCYENDSMTSIAFRNLLYYVENESSINFFLFIKGGIVLGKKENQIVLYHPNSNTNKIKKDLTDISNKYHQFGFVDIHYVLGRLEKFEK
jgi:hypothetical protein